MPDQPMPPLYTDSFEVTTTPWGASLRFGTRVAIPKQPGQPQQMAVEQVARLFMSLEHLKGMAFVLSREVLRFERQVGYQVQLPPEIIKGLDSTTEEWRRFWYGWRSRGGFGPSEVVERPVENVKSGDGPSEVGDFPFEMARPPGG